MTSKPPFAPLALDHVVIRARDVAALLAFYRDVLGCALARHNPKGLYHLRLGATMIDLLDLDGALADKGLPPPGAGPNMEHLCIRVAPFDEAAIRAHLAAHGVESEPAVQRFGAEGEGPSIYLRDPEGNRLELKAAL